MTESRPLAAVKAAISPLVYDGGHGAMDGPQVTDMVEEIAEAAVRALRPRTQHEYYDNARQNLISEHDCTFEDGQWWFGHGMPCQYPQLHAVEHAITYLRAIWMGLGEPTRNTPAGEIIAILQGKRVATSTQKEWAAEKDEFTADRRNALSEFLFTIYEHGTKPNALAEADAILAFLRDYTPEEDTE